MNVNLECIYCTIKKADATYSKYEKSEEKKLNFMKKIFAMLGQIEEGDTAPFLSAKIMKLLNEELALGDMYYDIKKAYNDLLLSMERGVLERINRADDKLMAGLKYAMVGNLIDFGAMDNVDMDQLKDIIEHAPNQSIDVEVYNKFLEELKTAKEMVYLVDNAGEIVFDKIFIGVIQKLYPDININVIVRGEPIYNDATIFDAKQIGLLEIVNVIENGTDIPGTQLNKINAESKEVIEHADLIISKGQGNFETLFGCNRNIYYIFLCKCDLFVKRFNMEKFSGVFTNEKNKI